MSHDRWILTAAPGWEGAFDDAAGALERLQHPDTLVQENDRGTVGILRHRGTQLVVKRSRIQERRRWIQALSILRGGEGARAVRNMARLRAAGLRVPEPVLALERIRWGFVVASWHAYVYLEGRPCTCADAALVAEALAGMHACGWVHRDPHVKNFLEAGGRAGIIDCAKSRPWRSRYARRYDVVLLDKCCPGARRHYSGFGDADPLYRLARLHNRWIVSWRRIKRAARAAGGVAGRA